MKQLNRNFQLVLIILVLVATAFISCSESGKRESNIIRGKLMFKSQIVPVYLTPQDVGVYNAGDTVRLFKAMHNDYYYISASVIDSNSIVAVLFKPVTTNKQ